MITSEFIILNLQETQITGNPNQNLTCLDQESAKKFLEEGFPSNCFSEYFLNIHGVRPSPQNFLLGLLNKSPRLLLSYNDKHILSDEIISKVIKNSSTDTVPVVHLLSCFSGAAHSQLKRVSGDVILCTYSEPNSTNIVGFAENFTKLRTGTASLTDYILDNISLCAAVGFSLSVKIGNKISTYKIDSNIVTDAQDLQEMNDCLKKEKEKFKYFSHSIFYEKNPLENQNKVIPLSPANFKQEKTSVTNNIALVIAVANSDLDKIKNLLNKVKIVPTMAVSIAIEENVQVLELLLDSKEFNPNQVTEYDINKAIEKNYDALDLLLNKNPNAITDSNLVTAIEKNKLDELQLLLKYGNEHFKEFDIFPILMRNKKIDPAALSLLQGYMPNLYARLTQVISSTGECLDNLSAQTTIDRDFQRPISTELPTISEARFT
ncbi:hypothetical protein [unidentified bacterial endosymbiont]|uniref:hypothetical protein n=1 Tax=unidentified bacterial endosymbiont TaxID=2355 RepID=UPI00209F3925|nr:hypothetical protein [unidentified bacterial endosymbiont]